MPKSNRWIATMFPLLLVLACKRAHEDENDLASAPPAAVVDRPTPTATFTEQKAGLITLARIQPGTARATALASLPGGKVTRAELEQDGERLIYSFDIVLPGKQEHLVVQVDGKTGELIRTEPAGKKAAR